MTSNINDLFKLVKEKNKKITHQVTQENFRMLHYYCSTYIEKQSILVKGEFSVDEYSDSIWTKLVFFDLKSGKVRGASRLSIFC